MIRSIRADRAEKKALPLELLCLLVLLAVFLSFELPRFADAPWSYYESWRQSDTYSIAVNYVQYGMHPLQPQLNYDGVSGNFAQLELQIIPYLSALVFQATGCVTPVVPRLLSLLFFLGSALFLYLLMKRISGLFPALAGLGIYLFMPLSLLTARAIQPESCALFFYCGGVFFLWKFQQTVRPRFLWLASGMTAVAIMEKTPVIFVGFLFLYALITVLGKRCLRSPLFYSCGAVTLLPPLALILYTSQHSTFRFVDGIASKHIFSEEIFSFFTAKSLRFFYHAFTTYFGWAAIIFTALGFFIALKQGHRFYVVWAVAFALECVTIVAVIQFTYYLVFLLPICAALISVAVQVIGKWKVPLALCACGAALLLTVQGSRNLWWVTGVDQGIDAAGQFIAAHTQAQDGVAMGVINPAYFNAANRRGYRANIMYYEEIPTGAEEELTYLISHDVKWFVVIDGAIYNDPDGTYLTYLREHFPLAATGTNCEIYDLQGN